MKKLIRIAGLLLAGLLVTTSASAYYASGSVIYDSLNNAADGQYTYEDIFSTPGLEGYMGDVNTGLPGSGARIGTPFLVTGSTTYTWNAERTLTADGATIHWFRFTASSESILDARYEWNDGYWALDPTNDTDIAFRIELFKNNGSDIAEKTYEFTSADIFNFSPSGHFDDVDFAHVAAGDWLIRITGIVGDDGKTSNDRYGVTLGATAVPLPPAALLFISALAGFGVIGRKKATS